MGNKIGKEIFDKGFNSSDAPLLVAPGEIVAGENLRAVGKNGGWTGRKGSTLRNTTAAGSAVVEALPYYNDITDYFRLLYHYGDYFYTGAASLAQAAGLGSSLGLDVGASVGHFCQIGDQLFYANGEGPPSVYSGDSIYCKAFIAKTAAFLDTDSSNAVTDGDTSTYATVTIKNDTGHGYLVCSPQRATGLVLTLGSSINAGTETLQMRALRGTVWSAVSGLSDGTSTTGTHQKSGTITWTASSSDSLSVVSGIMGYWYWAFVTTASETDPIDITSCRVICPMCELSSKWDGVFDYATGVYFYDNSDFPYSFEDNLGKVSNESQSTYMDLGSAETTDFIYIKHTVPLAGVGFGMVSGQVNDAAAVIDSVETTTSAGWTSVSLLSDSTSDGTSSFSDTGYAFWDFASITPQKAILEQSNDPVPGYWYRISWDVALDANPQVYLVVVAEAPESLAVADGCVEFDSRLILWGDTEYPNRLRYTPKNKPDNMTTTSSYTEAFGSSQKITVAKPFYEYLLVGKGDSLHLMDQDLAVKKITSEVGIVSPHTLQVVEVGTSNMQKELIVNVAIWLAADGVYQYDLEGVAKISLPINNYFDSNHSDYLTIAAISAAKSFIDQERNEYHLLIGSIELVYNYAFQIWYPPWDREISLTNGISFKDNTNAFYSFGFAASGFALQLENGTTDRSTLNAAVTITQSLITRVLTSAKTGLGVGMILRDLWFVVKTNSSAAPTAVKIYANFASSGTSLGTIDSNVASVAVSPMNIELSEQDCYAFQLELTLGTINKVLEIYEILYEYEEKSKIIT